MRRILFVTRNFPTDFGTAVYGSFQRLRMLLDAAASVAEGLDLLFFVDEHIYENINTKSFAAALRSHWGIDARIIFGTLGSRAVNQYNTYLSPMWNICNQDAFASSSGARQVRTLEGCISDETDLIVAHRLDMALAVRKIKGRCPPAVMDLDDVEHIKFARGLGRPSHWKGRYLQYLHVPAFLVGEIATVRAFTKTFVCSDKDRNYLRRLTLGADVEVVPNGVIFPISEDCGESNSNSLLFIGSYTYAPNIEAAELLLNNIFPIVRELMPTAHLLIAGNQVERLPSFGREFSGVEFVGFVQNVSELYRRVSVVCCPIQWGGGTRIKIIEAAAHGKPVVSTTLGAEGLEFEDLSEILLCDDPQTFARACVDLLVDHVRARTIGEKARLRAKPFDREYVVSQISAIYREAANGRISE